MNKDYNKLITLVITVLFFNVQLGFSQSSQQLDANNINAQVNTKGFLFGDPSQQTPGFEAPKGSGKHSVYAANLWLGNATHLAASTYYADSTDFSSGPLTLSGTTTPTIRLEYDRVWKVTQAEIDYHIAVKTGAINDPGYVVPQDIEDWPAHGDISLGYAQNLAPFVDVDNDNFYFPVDGDYPKIKGDVATYTIYNDYTTHQWSGGTPIGVEIHQMVYAYSCNGTPSLNNTVFVEYKIINRSTTTYNDFYFGAWTDIDIGNAYNEYVQCDVTRGCYFQFDENGPDDNSGATLGYGNYHPTQGVVILSGPWMDADGNDNAISASPNGIGFGDGINDNERLGMTSFMYQALIPWDGATWRDLPNTDYQLHGIMNAVWADGSLLYYGNMGYAPWAHPGNYRARFVYPGSSDPTGYGTNGYTTSSSSWDKDDNTLLASDNKSVGSMGPVTFSPGAIQQIELAYVFAQSNSPGVSIGKNLFIQYVDEIKNLYANNSLGCTTTGILTKNKKGKEVVVFPNPVKERLYINGLDNDDLITIKIVDVTGQQLFEKTTRNREVVLENLKPGVYFIEIITSNERVVKKIIKE
ncbi:MAG: T9SS type A sorting domain-containing protein [Vicingus serpentipes]|nr:T9SS type A sorting domain-containing protein [Vicingus serpentipes]